MTQSSLASCGILMCSFAVGWGAHLNHLSIVRLCSPGCESQQGIPVLRTARRGDYSASPFNAAISAPGNAKVGKQHCPHRHQLPICSNREKTHQKIDQKKPLQESKTPTLSKSPLRFIWEQSDCACLIQHSCSCKTAASGEVSGTRRLMEN